MDNKVRDYYAKNHLYARKMIMPGPGEMFRGSCQNCKFYVNVVGQQETRKVCLAEVRTYRSRSKRVPESIDIMDLMLLLGKEKLEAMLRRGGADKVACEEF